MGERAAAMEAAAERFGDLNAVMKRAMERPETQAAINAAMAEAKEYLTQQGGDMKRIQRLLRKVMKFRLNSEADRIELMCGLQPTIQVLTPRCTGNVERE